MKKSMKKVTAMTMAAMMAALLGGCGSSASETPLPQPPQRLKKPLQQPPRQQQIPPPLPVMSAQMFRRSLTAAF